MMMEASAKVKVSVLSIPLKSFILIFSLLRSRLILFPHEGQSEDGVVITTEVQKDDSGIYDIQTPPVILNTEPKEDEVVTCTLKTVS